MHEVLEVPVGQFWGIHRWGVFSSWCAGSWWSPYTLSSHFPFIHSVLSLGCCCLSHFMSYGHTAYESVLWIRKERNGSFWQNPAYCQRRWVLCSHALTFQWEKSQEEKGSLDTDICLSWRSGAVKSNCSFALHNVLNLRFCCCSNSVLELLPWTPRLNKASLICGWSSNWFSLNGAGRGDGNKV